MNECRCITKLLYFSTRGGKVQWFMTGKILYMYWKILGHFYFSHDSLRGTNDDFLLSKNEMPASFQEVKYVLRFSKT